MKKEEIKEIIMSWRFADCPTEKKEPFYWRWNRQGLTLLTRYIFDLLSSERQRAREEINKIEEWEETYCEEDEKMLREIKNEVLEILE